jgi:UTP--glucose-1-phosphate uridylyltransferase
LKIKKAVFPVAGLGTRFLPATKASPKEMMPIVDKPLIQYAVEEAISAGVTELIFVTGRGKRAIEDHFDRAVELELELERRQSRALLKVVKDILPPNVSCSYVRQTNPLGLGHAILCTAPLVGDEPFAVLLADDLIDAHIPVLKQMVTQFDHYGRTVIAVEKVPRDKTRQYGIVKIKGAASKLSAITQIVEKPAPEQAPSNLGVVGRYILPGSIFKHLRNLRAGAGKELQLTDAISSLITEEAAYAYSFEGVRYDCGSKLGYVEANLAYALAHPEIGADFARYIARKGWKR